MGSIDRSWLSGTLRACVPRRGMDPSYVLRDPRDHHTGHLVWFAQSCHVPMAPSRSPTAAARRPNLNLVLEASAASRCESNASPRCRVPQPGARVAAKQTRPFPQFREVRVPFRQLAIDVRSIAVWKRINLKGESVLFIQSGNEMLPLFALVQRQMVSDRESMGCEGQNWTQMFRDDCVGNTTPEFRSKENVYPLTERPGSDRPSS